MINRRTMLSGLAAAITPMAAFADVNSAQAVTERRESSETTPSALGIPASADWALATTDFSASEISSFNTWLASNPTPRSSHATLTPDSAKPNTNLWLSLGQQGNRLNSAGEWESTRRHPGDYDAHTGFGVQGTVLAGTISNGANTQREIIDNHIYSGGLEFMVPSAYIAKASTITWAIIAQHNSVGGINPPFAIQIVAGDLCVAVRGDARTPAQIDAAGRNYAVNINRVLVPGIAASTWYTLAYEIVKDETAAGQGRVKVWLNGSLAVNFAGQVGYNADVWVLWFGNYCSDVSNETYMHRIRNVWVRYDGPA